MIRQNEIKTMAREYGVPLSTIERDYAQNWLLLALSPFSLVFKGGTSIRKIYIEDYRFSDDLDFTLLKNTDEHELKGQIINAIEKAKEESGINFNDTIEFQENDNGFEISIYFQITQKGENKTKIKLDITKIENETIFLPIDTKKIIHPYSDSLDAEIKVYALEEIVVEKIRSLFQRTRPRDLYDVWYLWGRVDSKKVLDVLLEKFKTKNVNIDIEDLARRKNDFEGAWVKSLENQLKDLPKFEEVFTTVFELVKKCILR